MDAGTVDLIKVFADLVPQATPETPTMIQPATVEWLTLDSLASFPSFQELPAERYEPTANGNAFTAKRTDTVERIVSTAALRDDEELLRMGWLWVAGTTTEGASVFHPLVSRTCRRSGLSGAIRSIGASKLLSGTRIDLVPSGELEISDLITDPAVRDNLASTVQYGGGALDGNSATVSAALLSRLHQLSDWALAASEAAGHRATSLVGVSTTPTGHAHSAGIHVIAGAALYLDPQVSRASTTAASLLSWTSKSISGTAFDALYGSSAPAHAPETYLSHTAVDSALVLSRAQRDVVLRSRHRTTSVVSGPPGTGKSQALVAAAFDAVARGESVLVTAPSDAAVAALVDLFESAPGPDPIVLGGGSKRFDVAQRLAETGTSWVSSDVVDQHASRLQGAQRRRNEVRIAIAQLLDAESFASTGPPSRLLAARVAAPGFFDVDADLAASEHQLRRATSPGSPWFRTRRQQRAARRLAQAARAEAGVGTDRLAELLSIAKARQAATRLESAGGLDLTSSWHDLCAAEAAVRSEFGQWLSATAKSADRANRSALRAVSSVASALRSGREVRRRSLAEIPGDDLTAALPIWVATLRDIDDLLPNQPAMFDLVVLDEASQIDQISAAPALLRAKRALIVGDPKQLRHVSFLSGDAISSAVSLHGIEASVAAQADPRRQSLFDAATAVESALLLDEHHRSAAHLIEFAGDNFYNGHLTVATRHPSQDTLDCIDVERVSGRRDEDGSNQLEVEHVIANLRQTLAAVADAADNGEAGNDDQTQGGRPSIGVVTPFRAQADLLEKQVLTGFSLDEIDQLHLRIGTVHGFQGCERDQMIVSLALDDESPPGSRRFVNEPNLFNVMITRARQHLTVVTSLSSTGSDRASASDDLLTRYLKYADRPPVRRTRAGELSDWGTRVRSALESTVPLLAGYPVGNHLIDLVAGPDRSPTGLICGVHPDGADAHIERHLSLVGSGWHLREVFETRWTDRLAELAIDLAPTPG